MQPATIQLLRDIEAGAVLYDPEFTMRHTFTFIGDGDRVYLRDSGLSLLFAIDCDFEQLRAEIEPIILQIKREALGRYRAELESSAQTLHRWKQEARARDKRKKVEADRSPLEGSQQMSLLELETSHELHHA